MSPRRYIPPRCPHPRCEDIGCEVCIAAGMHEFERRPTPAQRLADYRERMREGCKGWRDELEREWVEEWNGSAVATDPETARRTAIATNYESLLDEACHQLDARKKSPPA